MKKVYICSPCRGDYENNIQRAKEFSRAAVERGCIPITPHIYLTQFMDDTVPAERELGLSIGRELVLMCDELWAFGLDCPTAGMAAEIELARERGIPVRNGFKAISEIPETEKQRAPQPRAHQHRGGRPRHHRPRQSPEGKPGQPARDRRVIAMDNPKKNAEGYNDPTPYEAEKHIRAHIRGKQARLAGSYFESMISGSCDYDLDRGLAKIEKTPEPMKPLGPKNYKGQFLACYTKQAQPDYKGTLKGGRAVVFEAKHTDDDRIEFNRLTKEQRDDLEHHHKLGAVAFVLVSMSLTECFRVPWPVWRDMAATYGRKYMTRDELKPYKVPVVAGFVKFLDKLPPEVITVKDLSPEELERLKQMIREQPSTIIVGEVKP